MKIKKNLTELCNRMIIKRAYVYGYGVPHMHFPRGESDLSSRAHDLAYDLIPQWKERNEKKIWNTLKYIIRIASRMNRGEFEKKKKLNKYQHMWCFRLGNLAVLLIPLLLLPFEASPSFSHSYKHSLLIHWKHNAVML